MLDKLNFRFHHKVPVIHQTESSECGLACLAMVCGFYGKNIDLISLRQQFSMSTRGMTLTTISGIGSQLGMDSRALSLEMEEIGLLRLPCILHWDFNHFVVLVDVGKASCVIHDPAHGRKYISFKEMADNFTGIALELTPGSLFKSENKNNRLNLSVLFNSIHGLTAALSKIFFLSLIIETINLLMPVGTQLVMDHAIPAGDSGLLTLICTGLLFFILLRSAVSILRAWSSLIIGTQINVQWQSSLFQHLLRLPLAYFEHRKLGDIQSRFTSLEALRTTFTTSLTGAIMDTIMVTGVAVMLFMYGGWLAWVVVGFTTLYALIRSVTYDYYRQLSEESLVREARASSYFMETLYGIATVKMQGMGDRRRAHWLNLKIDAINTGIRITKMDLLFGGINGFIAALDQVAILWIGTFLVINNQMTIGMFVAFGVFRDQFSERIGSLINFIFLLKMMGLHNERISDIALNAQEARKPDYLLAINEMPFEVKTENISFRYDDHSNPVFNSLSITVFSGESVAITGPSGAGKTTLMKVLCGLVAPENGKVTVNGMDIWKIGINNYHKIISCVMQDDKLFSGSIRENICGFTEDIDFQWVEECARASYIHETIMAMPMGYETLIGELGEGLSGGQKQRIFIARALYRKPKILFMDEATSSLDAESEYFVCKSISALKITRVLIAHRESTLATVDRIIRL